MSLQTFYGCAAVPESLGKVSVTLGVFDGLHRAHRAIVERVITYARAQACRAMLITFDPHPRQVLNNQNTPIGILTTLEEKLALLEQWGIDYVLILKSEGNLLQKSPQAFVQEILVNRLRVAKVFIGYDYHFGYNRQGNAALCVEMGRELGFEVEIVPPYYYQGELVKSSTIRRLLAEGQIDSANRLLGRFYSFSGTVVKGSGRGRQLGFPTANLVIAQPDKSLPARGVYLAQAGAYYGMLNIGLCQTFGGKELSIELHLFDYSAGDLYGQQLTVAVLEKLRDEERFPSPTALIRQLEADRELCRLKMKNYKHEMEVINNDVS